MNWVSWICIELVNFYMISVVKDSYWHKKRIESVYQLSQDFNLYMFLWQDQFYAFW